MLYPWRWQGRKRFIPRLERLEGRDCPSLSVGPNLNLSRMLDNQAHETVAIDPSNPQRLFVASTTWHGGYAGTINLAAGQVPGALFASWSTNGGVTWSSRLMATGEDGVDGLPAGMMNPHAAFDQFGNLFVAYHTGEVEYAGTATLSTQPNYYVLTDPNANWGINEWQNRIVDLPLPDDTFASGPRATILSNDAHSLYVALNGWSQPPPPDGPVGYNIQPQYLGGSDLQVIESTDGGQSFAWLYDWGPFTGNYPATELTPYVATGPGSQPGQGSVWLLWASTNGRPMLTGAPVTGLGQVGSFITPEQPQYQLTNYLADTGLSVGPGGQVMITWQTQLQMAPPDYYHPKASIYVATDPDGLGSAGFNQPVWVTYTYENAYSYSIPAMADWGINASARLAYDRSGGAHNGRVYMVYGDSTGSGSSDTNVFERYSDNDGSTWSARVQVNDDHTSTSQFTPSAAVDQSTGYLAVTWYDARNDPNNIRVQLYGTVSYDGGASFDSNVAIAAGQSDGLLANSESVGTITSDGYYTMTDTNQHWTPDWWGGGAFEVYAYDPGYGYISAVIEGNSSNTLYLRSDGWGWENYPPPPAGTQYTIYPFYQRDMGEYTDVAYVNGTFWATWADNSNSTQDNPDAVENTLDVYVAAVAVTPPPGGGGGSGSGSSGQGGGSSGGGGGYGNGSYGPGYAARPVPGPASTPQPAQALGPAPGAQGADLVFGPMTGEGWLFGGRMRRAPGSSVVPGDGPDGEAPLF